MNPHEAELQAFIAEAEKVLFQPYYYYFLFSLGYPLTHENENMLEFIFWVDARHKDYAPKAEIHFGDHYVPGFMKYLHDYALRAREAK